MEVTLKVKIKPFAHPNFVVLEQSPKPRQEGLINPSSIPLSELDSDVLSRLCNEFTASVFKKAGKQQPPQPACNCGS